MKIYFLKKTGYEGCLDILLEANSNSRLTGFVHALDENKERFFVVLNGELAGFVSPRLERGLWRLGAVYCKEKYRNSKNGFCLMEQLIFHVIGLLGEDYDFFELVDEDNFQMKKLLTKCGFSFNYSDNRKLEIWGKS